MKYFALISFFLFSLCVSLSVHAEEEVSSSSTGDDPNERRLLMVPNAAKASSTQIHRSMASFGGPQVIAPAPLINTIPQPNPYGFLQQSYGYQQQLPIASQIGLNGYGMYPQMGYAGVGGIGGINAIGGYGGIGGINAIGGYGGYGGIGGLNTIGGYGGIGGINAIGGYGGYGGIGGINTIGGYGGIGGIGGISGIGGIGGINGIGGYGYARNPLNRFFKPRYGFAGGYGLGIPAPMDYGVIPNVLSGLPAGRRSAGEGETTTEE